MITWQLVVLLIGIVVLIPRIWRKPVLGIYVLVGACVLFENFPLGFPDSFTDQVPFFWNLNNSAGLPISANPAEVLIAVTMLATIASASARRRAAPFDSHGFAELPPERPNGRALRGAYIAFLGVVLFAEVHGMLAGGNWNISLWEMRPQVYGFLLFILAGALIRERRQVAWLAGIFLVCTAIKAGLGFDRYFIVMHQDLANEESILGHEDSYFLALFVVATVIAMVWQRRRKVVLPLAIAAPIVAVVMFENRRRAAELALVGALVVVVAMGIRFVPEVRVKLAVVSVTVTLMATAFVVVNWNVQSGIASQIVRPVRTAMGQVDYRDYLSDLYRTNENLDIKFTYSTTPLIGTGFGLPFLLPFPLADISENYPLWNYIPHNSLLWVAMRMGLLGMAAFWALIGTVVLEGVRVVRTQSDRLLQAAAVFALASVVAELLVGYADVQLEAYRNMIFLGVMIGLIEALPRLQPAVAPEVDREEAPLRGLTRYPIPAAALAGRRAEG